MAECAIESTCLPGVPACQGHILGSTRPDTDKNNNYVACCSNQHSLSLDSTADKSIAAISMDRDTLDEQARPVNMAAPTQEFLCQQLERRCTTAVQAMGGSRSLAEAVYQQCQPEPGIFRCPNCGRKSGSDISKLKSRCWSDKKSGCLESTVQMICPETAVPSQLPLPDFAKGEQGMLKRLLPSAVLSSLTAQAHLSKVHQDSSPRPDNAVMLTMVNSFMTSLLAGRPDTLQFPSSWWDKSPKSATSTIYQALVNVDFLLIPVHEDSVYFVWLPALRQHFAGMFQRERPQAAPAATAFPNKQNNVCNTLTGDSSALPLCTAAASPSQQNSQKFCKDCTTAEIVLIRGVGAAMDTDTCTFQPADRAAQTLRANLSHRDDQGDTQVSLLLRVHRCGQNLCVTVSELAGSFQPSVSDTYVVQTVHISMQAASSGEPIPLVLYLRQSQELHQLQARNIQVRQAAHRIAHDHTHRDIAADPEMRFEGGAGGTGALDMKGLRISEKRHDLETVAQTHEDLVLSRLFPGSNALSQGTTFELKRYVDRCYKNNETQLSTLSFDGCSGDPVLFKGQLLGRPDEKVTLQCSAVVNITAIRRTRCEKLFGVSPKKMSKMWAKDTPQYVVARNRYISHDVKLCRAPAHVSVEM